LVESADEPDNLDKPFEKTSRKESMISLDSQDLLIKNKDLSNLGVFIEKQTDPKVNKVFAKVQIKMVESVGDSNFRSSMAKL